MTVRSDQWCEVVEVEEVLLLLPHLLGPDPPARAVAVAVGEHGLHHRHRVEALAVAARLDVGVLVGVEARGDRHAVGVVGLVRAGRDRAEDRLGVGAREVAEPLGEAGQVALVLHPVQQLLGAEGRRGEDDVLGGDHAGARGRGALGLRVLDVDVVAAVGARGDPGDGGQRQHLRAALLGEVEVVLDQGVLGVVAAARHALAAVEAGVAGRALTAEERVRDLLARAGPRGRRRTRRPGSGGRCRPRPSRRRPSPSRRRPGVRTGFSTTPSIRLAWS